MSEYYADTDKTYPGTWIALTFCCLIRTRSQTQIVTGATRALTHNGLPPMNPSVTRILTGMVVFYIFIKIQGLETIQNKKLFLCFENLGPPKIGIF